VKSLGGNMEKNIVKVCGIETNCNCNFDKKHIEYLVNLLHDKFYCERRIEPNLLECIAGLTFVITGDFEASLDNDADILDDIKKTQENLDRLENYFGVLKELLEEGDK